MKKPPRRNASGPIALLNFSRFFSGLCVNKIGTYSHTGQRQDGQCSLERCVVKDLVSDCRTPDLSISAGVVSCNHRQNKAPI